MSLKYQDPQLYIIELQKVADKFGVKIRSSSESPTVGVHPLGGDVSYTTQTNTVYLSDPASRETNRYVHDFEHELTHAIQHALNPRMSIEQKEYEAYLVGVNMKNFTDPVWMKDYGLLAYYWGVVDISIPFHYKEYHLPNPWFEVKVPRLKLPWIK